MTRRLLVLLALLPSLALAQGYIPGSGPSGGASSAVPSPTGPLGGATQTTGALALFVDPTGSDANACTSSGVNACLTGDAAVAKVPKRLKHGVTIDYAAGTYTGSNLTGFVCEPGGWLLLRGTMIASTITGTQAGTVTSGTAGSNSTGVYATMTVTTPGWTVDALRAKFVRIPTGTGAGQIRAIASNTASVLTLPGAWTAPNGTSTFEIVEPGTIIATGATRGAQLDSAASANFAGFIVRDNISYGDTTAGCIYIERMKFTAPRSIQAQDTDGVFSRYNWLAQSASNASIVVGQTTGRPSTVNAHDNVSTSAGVFGQTLGQFSTLNLLRNVNSTSAGFVTMNSTGQTTGASIIMSSNYVRGFTNEAVLGQAGQIFAQGNKFDGVTAGAAIYAYRLGTQASQTPVNGWGWFSMSADDIINVGHGVHVSGGWQGVMLGVTGTTGNTAGTEAQRGASVQINSAVTLTGTTELAVDGEAFTLATMRAPAAGLRAINNGLYGTVVYE